MCVIFKVQVNYFFLLVACPRTFQNGKNLVSVGMNFNMAYLEIVDSN